MQQNEVEDSRAVVSMVKQERDASPRIAAAVPGDKENSEPMETASTIAEMLTAPTATSSPHVSTLTGAVHTSSASSTDSPVRFASPQKNSSRSSLQTKAAVAAMGTPELRSMTGTPQSLTQFIANLPSSAFSSSFDNLPDFQSPIGSGLLSPIGSARLGKKRPLSISPLSCSSVNIDSLIRGSPTSLMGYLAGSRSSSAGSFGHLSPSLYISTTNVHTFSRPVISLAKAVHPAANSFPGGSTQKARQTTVKEENSLSYCTQATRIQNGSEHVTHDKEMEVATTIVVSTSSNDYSSLTGSEMEREGRPEEQGGTYHQGKSSQKANRIYYSYPSAEQPHNNKCRWRDCTRQCDSLEDLVRHVNTDHVYQDSKREFVCYWDGCVRDRRSFKAQYMLLVHMRRHTGEKPHKCQFEGCDKAYSRLENLKTHVRSHTGERPYVCKFESCGKAFSNASDCAKHMNRTHSDEKPYACQNPGCTKRYTDPSSRRKHMKNCQVNKRVHTADADTTSGTDENTGEGSSAKPISGSSRKATRARKAERKKRDEVIHTHYPTHSSNDLGYSSGGSHTTSFVSHMTGQAHQSEYSSSGYDTEYSTDQPPVLNYQVDRLDCSPMVWSPTVTIKDEFYAPATLHPIPQMSHVTNGHVLQTATYQIPARARATRHVASKPSNLSTLPEISLSATGTPPQNLLLTEQVPNCHIADPFVGIHGPPSDETASVSSSLNSSGRHNSLKSEYSNSRSSFSPYSSRVSSAAGSSNGHDNSISSNVSHRSIQPPNHILHPPHQSLNSIQPFDLKYTPHYYRRQSDEMSMRSSHSSRYSGSEYSDDYCTHLPVQHNAFSPHQPLPFPQSMQQDFLVTPATTAGYYNKTSPPKVDTIHNSGAQSEPSDVTGGSLPLRHYELGPTDASKASIAIPEAVFYERASSPNMVIGSMSTFTEQLHQESMLLGGLSATTSASS